MGSRVTPKITSDYRDAGWPKFLCQKTVERQQRTHDVIAYKIKADIPSISGLFEICVAIPEM